MQFNIAQAMGQTAWVQIPHLQLNDLRKFMIQLELSFLISKMQKILAPSL